MVEILLAVFRVCGTAVLMILMIPVACLGFLCGIIFAAVGIGWNASRSVVHYIFFKQDEEDEELEP